MDFPDLPESIAAREARPSPSGPRSKYVIDVELDSVSHTLRGVQTIHWVNHSRRTIRRLPIHLYLNAFKKGSLYLDPRFGGGRSGGLVGREGGIEVQRVTSPKAPGEDLWERAEPHSPNLPSDHTDIGLPLPFSVAPRERIELRFEFTAKLPEVVERTGYQGDFHLLGQWFPKIAKLQRSGQFSHDAFHPFAEFYADFADYEVRMSVPDGFVVGSTGRLVEKARRGNLRVYEAKAERVIDFAWTAFPGAEVTETELSGVQVRLLLPKGSPRSRKIHLFTIARGLEQLGVDYGAYPYPTLTVVQPPNSASRAGGMEYPSFITTGGSEFGAFLGTRQTELLVIHELAHQWFQSLIATNEREHPYLDEGLTSYAEWRYLARNYGAGSLWETPLTQLSREAGGRMAAFYGSRAQEPLDQPAAEFESFRTLAAHIYGRTPLLLMTLGRVFGPKKLTAALGDYAQSERFGHPGPAELERALARHLGGISRRSLRQLFSSPGGFELKVGDLKNRRTDEGYETTVQIVANQILHLPFDVRIEFADGTAKTARLPGKKKREELTFESPSPIVLVHADPNHHLLIDENLEDNRRIVGPHRSFARRSRAWASFFSQAILASLRP